MIKLYGGILLLLFVVVSHAQEKKVMVYWTEQPITLDGLLTEPQWSKAEPAKDFWQHFPTDSVLSSNRTEIKMLFDKKYLYIGIAVEAIGNDFIVPSLKRDFRARGNDNITLIFDTFNDGNTAFVFGTNSEGVQREALLSGGGARVEDFNDSWDVKWENVAKVYDNFYIVEMKIPLASFKFREGETKWRFNAYRFDTQSNEQSIWINTPQNQSLISLAYAGDMVFERPLDKTRVPFAVIPYVSGGLNKDYEFDQIDNSFNIGGDAKIPIGNSMNLDLTFNPDFSQVEVDEQVVNLTRFEAFLPEKRQFFIDNADLFGNFGNGQSANPFFSRRIGIAKNLEDENIENSILAGARLSGKLTDKLRIGVLDIQTAEDKNNEIPTNNNAVIALQQKVLGRSNLGFIFVNRQVTNDPDFLVKEESYNRVLGLDFNLLTDSNIWSGKAYVHKSFVPGDDGESFSSGGFLDYNTRFWKFNLGSTYIGKDFQADLGFVRREDILTVDPVATRIFYPINSSVNTHTLELRSNLTWSPDRDFLLTDGMVDLEYQIRFNNQSSIEMAVNHSYTYLLEDFDPTRSDGVPLPAFTDYSYTKFDFTFQSDLRKSFSYRLRTDLGQFFNGEKYSLLADMGLRIQPYFTASLKSSVNYVTLPEPYETKTILFIGPKFDVTFTKNLFWSTYVQYNSLDEAFGFNSRLQWRFKPLSDLFVVYNSNYGTTPVSPGTRTLIVKLTYWINI